MCNVPQALSDISQNYIIDLIEKDKMVYDQFEWLPETEKNETGFLRYDLVHCILISPFSFSEKSVTDRLWNDFILQPYECDSVVSILQKIII